MKRFRKTGAVVVCVVVTACVLICAFLRRPQASAVTVSWSEYQDLFEYVVDHFEVDGLEVKASTKGRNVVAMDAYAPLDNRRFLTLSGGLDGATPQTTLEQFVVEDAAQSVQVTFSLIYTTTPLGNDILAYTTNDGFDTLDAVLKRRSTAVLGTYENLLFMVSQTALSEVDATLNHRVVDGVMAAVEAFYDGR
ncbi:hypothetical protein ACR6HW_08710 [Fusibacter sp. JL298sf-3]